MTLTALAVLAGLSVPPFPTSAATASAPDSLVGPGAEVPYVGQEPLLCGGAAIAMVARYWGSTGVYAEDFRSLVREDEGGIRTTDLADALGARGHEVRVVNDRPATVFAALEQGIPAILLLGGGDPLLHYVVLVQADEYDVWVHDSAWGPLRRMSREELDARWRESDRWALLSGPGRATATGGMEEPEPSGDAPETAGSRLVDEAIASLRAGSHDEARADARELLEAGGEYAETGRRLLATSFFLAGETEPALEEWNALGEPRIDLVSIDGSTVSRHDVLVRRTGLAAGQLLTPGGLRLARRRLAEEPSLEGSRVTFRPNLDGTAQVVAHVLERPPLPTPRRLGMEVARGFVNHEVGVEAGPLLGSADVWSFELGWSPASSKAGGQVEVAAPPLPGIVTVGLDWVRERHAEVISPGSEIVASYGRLRGYLGVREWVRPDIRMDAAVGLERWRDGERVGTASAGWRWDRDVFWTEVGVQGWTGPREPFWKGSVEAGVVLETGRHQRWRWRGGAATVSDAAPRLVWPGAGIGQVRPALLRAYPLVEDGVVSGPGLGRGLLHTTAEYRLESRVGPVRAGIGIFGDAALVRRPDAGDRSDLLTDAGIELYVAPGSSEATVSLARGNSGWVLSARVSEAW